MSNENHYSYLDELDIPKHNLLRKSKRDPTVFLRLYNLLRDRKMDILHSWSSICSVYALPTIMFLPVKFVNGFLRNAPPYFSFRDKEWRRAKLTFLFSDIIAANSYAGLKSYNVPKNKAACIHNGFDFTRVQNLANKDEIREKFNVRTKYVVGMVANFSDNKDHETFIKSAYLVLEERDDVTFVVVGHGENFKSIKRLIGPKFENRIKFIGKQKRVLNIVNIFDIGVLTTFTEGISNAIMEYMSLKKPAIVTDCFGNRELVEDGRTGFFVEAANPNQIKERIFLLLENKHLSETLGKNGFKKLENEYNLGLMGNDILKLYRSLV